MVIGGGTIAPGWGIGKAIAAVYAREGALVAVADINRDAAEDTAEIIERSGGHAKSYCVDVTDEASIGRMITAVKKEF